MENTVISIIKEVRKDINTDNPSSNLLDEWGIASVDIMNIILKLETNFEISFDDDDLDLDNFLTVERICSILKKYEISHQ